MSSRILFVGRQPDQFAALWRHLKANEGEVAFAASQKRALSELDSISADVIVLDATGLRASPTDMCRALRRRSPTARIILISDPEAATSLSYDHHLGAKPTWKRLLEAVQLALSEERRQVITAGPFVLDLLERTVVGPAGEGRLTPKQFGLLHLLMTHANQLVPRRQIMQVVWHTDFVDDTRTLDVHMSWLRRVIEPDPTEPIYLRTRRGQGYIFLPDGEEPQGDNAFNESASELVQ